MTKDNLTYNQKLLNTSNRIAFILSILTVILFIITAWYAYSTKAMVDIMRSDFEISNRPYIAIRSMDKKKYLMEFHFGMFYQIMERYQPF